MRRQDIAQYTAQQAADEKKVLGASLAARRAVAEAELRLLQSSKQQPEIDPRIIANLEDARIQSQRDYQLQVYLLLSLSIAH